MVAPPPLSATNKLWTMLIWYWLFGTANPKARYPSSVIVKKQIHPIGSSPRKNSTHQFVTNDLTCPRLFCYTIYDSGTRVRKTVNGVEHIYTVAGSQIVSEAWGDELLIYLYDINGNPMGMEYRNSTYAEGTYSLFLFQTNFFGDIIAIYDESGNELVSYTYDAFGACTISTTSHATGNDANALKNPFRYRGYYYDTDLGLYMVGNRYYDPVTGRFISADFASANDASINSYNLFAYANNNTVNNTYTPTGTITTSVSTPIKNENSVSYDLLPPFGTYAFFDLFATMAMGEATVALDILKGCGVPVSYHKTATKILNKAGIGLSILSSVVYFSNSTYNNFQNPNYSFGESVIATSMDAFYYGCAGFATFAMSDEVAALAVAAGVSVNAYLAGAGVVSGVAIGAGLFVGVVIFAGCVLLVYGVSSLLDYAYQEGKNDLFT